MREFSVAELKQALKAYPSASFGEDFFIMDFCHKADTDLIISYPCKFKGVMCLFCMEGCLNYHIGMGKYVLTKDSFSISLPGDIINIVPMKGEMFKLRILALSDKIVTKLNQDMFQAQLAYRERVIKTDRQCKMMIHNFGNLFKSLVFRPHENTQQSLTLMVGAMNMELENAWNRLSGKPEGSINEMKLYNKFVALVEEYHTQHRDVKFYAGKMMLTPKYLAAVINKACGKSALQIIIEHVLMEARFHLKYTDLPVKEIAYRLNFKNQMDFYSFFKRHYGCSPAEFRAKSRTNA